MSKRKLPEPIRDRILKVRALAQNGANTAECQAAQALLDKLLAKYGAVLSDILGDQPERFLIKYTGNDKDLFLRCFDVVVEGINVGEGRLKKAQSIDNKWHLMVMATMQEYIDACEMFNYYRAIYKREIKRSNKDTMTAIINKYNLFSQHTRENHTREMDDDEALRVHKKTRDINADPYAKRGKLNGPGTAQLPSPKPNSLFGE